MSPICSSPPQPFITLALHSRLFICDHHLHTLSSPITGVPPPPVNPSMPPPPNRSILLLWDNLQFAAEGHQILNFFFLFSSSTATVERTWRCDAFAPRGKNRSPQNEDQSRQNGQRRSGKAEQRCITGHSVSLKDNSQNLPTGGENRKTWMRSLRSVQRSLFPGATAIPEHLLPVRRGSRRPAALL